MKQKTIAQAFSLSGHSLHSGAKSTLFVSPAPPDSGIYFIKEGKRIPALVRHVRETRRGTSLDGIAVIEHFLAATFALGIDNLQVEIKGEELPAMDGSALPYVEAFEQCGAVEQTAEKAPLIIERPVRVAQGDSLLEALPHHGFQVDFMVDFPGAGGQRRLFDLRQGNFKEEIAPARTFGYIEEYEMLKQSGLARGASFENALVLGKDGYVNPPRFPDEIVRHKILDLLGDLALIGRPIEAKINALRSGHRLNVELARRLSQ